MGSAADPSAAAEVLESVRASARFKDRRLVRFEPATSASREAELGDRCDPQLPSRRFRRTEAKGPADIGIYAMVFGSGYCREAVEKW